MRLATVGISGEPRIAAFRDDVWIDVTQVVRSVTSGVAEDDMIGLIRGGPAALDKLAALLDAAAPNSLTYLDEASFAWLPPVVAPSKIVCMALNNRALDSVKVKAPTDHPAFFVKTQTALLGHRQPIKLRPSFGLTHPEPELAVVIGRKLSNATPEEAREGVFGYTIMNDVTSVGMRDEDSFTFRFLQPDPAGGDPVAAEGHTSYPGRYKGSDGFAPLGPYIVTSDEIADPDALDIRSWLGKALIADDNTRNYVWSVADALSQVSRTMTLLPGDVLAMGTAVGAEPASPKLRDIPGVTRANLVGHDGDITIEISGLGRLSNPTVTAG